MRWLRIYANAWGYVVKPRNVREEVVGQALARYSTGMPFSAGVLKCDPSELPLDTCRSEAKDRCAPGVGPVVDGGH
jgi:hypothetical protein